MGTRKQFVFGLIVAMATVLSIVYLSLLARNETQVSASFSQVGLILVPARVGGVDGRYLLDTGCDTTTVSPRIAATLEPTGKSVEVSSSLSVNDPLRATAALSGGIQFAAGSLRFPTQVNVMDLSRLSTLLHNEVDGILGWDVLRNYVIGIDSRGKAIFAGRKISATAMLKRLGVERAALRLTLESLDESPFLTVTSDTRPLRLMLDTGATMTTLFSETWERLCPERPAAPDPQNVSWGVTGESPVGAGRLKELSIGSFRLSDVSVAVSSVTAAVGQKGTSTVSFDGILGMNVLSRFIVVIDGPESVLYLAQ